MGKRAEAIAEWREAIRLEPNNGILHFTLGLALSKQGELEEAIAEYRAAIRIEPRFADAHSNLGLAPEHARAVRGGDRRIPDGDPTRTR